MAGLFGAPEESEAVGSLCNSGTRAAPALAAEVDLDHLPDLLGEMECLRAIRWARLALRVNRPSPQARTNFSVTADAASRLGVSRGWL